MLTIKTIAANTLRLLIDGEITQEAIQQASSQLKQIIDEHGSVRMLIEVKDLEGYDSVSAFLKDSGETFQHYTDFEKIALVTDEKWLSGLTSFSDLINPANIKEFSPQEKTLAQEWVTQ